MKKENTDTILELIGGVIMFMYSFIVSLLLKEKDVVVTFLFLMLIDTITGIAASIKRKNKITSWKLLKGVSIKFMIFFIVAILGIFIKYYAGVDVIKAFILLGAIVEALSIKENIEILYEVDIFNTLLNKLKQVIKYKSDIKQVYDELKEKEKDTTNGKDESNT
jgi:hypothetical protein